MHAVARPLGAAADLEKAPSLPLSLRRPLSPQPSDDDLIARLQRGDTTALDSLLSKYWTLVVDYIARLTGVRDIAEDVAQRTFCQLWDRRAQWRITGSVHALLYRMARNIAVSERRRDGARERSAAIFAQSPRPNPTPVDNYDNAQLRQSLERAISELPERRREIFVLRCVHGLSYKDIATILDVAPQTVANQLSSALRTLREDLGHLLD